MPQRNSRARCPAPLADSKVRLIHVARRQLGLTDEDYRSILGLMGGVAHAADLDPRGFTAVMARFEALGFRSTSPRRPLSVRTGMATPGQVSLIRQLWAECTDGQGTDATLGKWLERQFHVSSVRFVTLDLAPRVIGAMNAMKAKRKARDAASARKRLSRPQSSSTASTRDLFEPHVRRSGVPARDLFAAGAPTVDEIAAFICRAFRGKRNLNRFHRDRAVAEWVPDAPRRNDRSDGENLPARPSAGSHSVPDIACRLSSHAPSRTARHPVAGRRRGGKLAARVAPRHDA